MGVRFGKVSSKLTRSDKNRARKLDNDKNSKMAAQHSPRNKRDCAAAGVCAKETKLELNTLDEADFVRPNSGEWGY